MNELAADVAVLGSGFGGSLTALLLRQVGLVPVLIDRGKHPRFAIGESSTPIADSVLARLAREYNLPRLAPLAKYGTWRATYPGVGCGPKRGFSYFRHEPGTAFQPRHDHANELLVAASAGVRESDTHWFRADVDAFLAGEVQSAGVPCFDQTDVSVRQDGRDWILRGTRLDESVRVRAKFLVDASGPAGVIQRALAIPSDVGRLATHSRALFSHFVDVSAWQELFVDSGGSIEEHPFPCDHAALHHVFDEGWMWQLRFDNGVTSVGAVLDSAERPLDERVSPEAEWKQLLERYPTIGRQLEKAKTVDPPGRLLRTSRLQRLARRMVGENWAMLPHTAGFIDPLHSTGIAHTLCAIERLVPILEKHWDAATLTAALSRYEAALIQEFSLVDRLVSGCYAARRSHRLFTAFSMLYFAAATTYEHRRHAGELTNDACFLCADDAGLRGTVEVAWQRIVALAGRGEIAASHVSEFERELAAAIRPYNRVGLCDPGARNMYRYTAAPL